MGQPLEDKVRMTESRIHDWVDNYGTNSIYTSISGGKDSTVLHHIVKSLYPSIPSIFIDTGLEYPEIRKFALSLADIIRKPTMTFKQVLDVHGFPVASKETSQKIKEARTTKSEKLRNIRLGDTRSAVSQKWRYLLDAPFKISDRCCNELKKKPAKKIEAELGLHPMLGTMVEDSQLRRQTYYKNGCNGFDMKSPRSMPLAFWTTDDVWEYIKKYKIPYASIYDKGWDRTGCMFCMFGLSLEKTPNRFQRMEKTHPQLHKYCIEKLGLGEILDYMKIPYSDSHEQLTLRERQNESNANK